MATKYYVDENGNYVGGYDGASPPSGSIEVPVAPNNARDVWDFDGDVWIPYVYPPAAVTKFTSTNQTITSAGILTIAHGLSSAPALVVTYLKCVTAQNGYSVGDKVMAFLDVGAVAVLGVNNQGASICVDATNLVVRFGSNAAAFVMVNKTSGATVNATNANWKLVLEAWA